MHGPRSIDIGTNPRLELRRWLLLSLWDKLVIDSGVGLTGSRLRLQRWRPLGIYAAYSIGYIQFSTPLTLANLSMGPLAAPSSLSAHIPPDSNVEYFHRISPKTNGHLLCYSHSILAHHATEGSSYPSKSSPSPQVPLFHCVLSRSQRLRHYRPSNTTVLNTTHVTPRISPAHSSIDMSIIRSLSPSPMANTMTPTWGHEQHLQYANSIPSLSLSFIDENDYRKRSLMNNSLSDRSPSSIPFLGPRKSHEIKLINDAQ
ncbi:hypothetical protein BDP27DRAFT_1446288 [Rhodocollybia butyracea]|uniref:Uncharacterized protein n=1 Tax=Rhodocollybia butyracea TaxID=206335 RepID=A0A9P5PSM9_9AGAR|nr:hypothetical protein BDP27DRAFT_1446288 [Rhodocollybia butyracea]